MFHFAMLVAAAILTESAWWEGRWVDQWTSCEATTGDRRPITLTPTRLQFIEAECWLLNEVGGGQELVLRARCRDHGEAAERLRKIRLHPSEGGRAMVMRMGEAEWHLRKCARR
jgi:hypothetical protein